MGKSMQEPPSLDLVNLLNNISISTPRCRGNNVLVEWERYEHYDHQEIYNRADGAHGLRSIAGSVSIVSSNSLTIH